MLNLYVVILTFLLFQLLFHFYSLNTSLNHLIIIIKIHFITPELLYSLNMNLVVLLYLKSFYLNIKFFLINFRFDTLSNPKNTIILLNLE